MLAIDVSAERCLENWLYGAGTNDQGWGWEYPTLTLYNYDVRNKILELQNNGCNYLPDNWMVNISYQQY